MQKMGKTDSRPFCLPQESEMQVLLLPCWDWQTLPRRCVRWPLAPDPHISLPTIPIPRQGNCPNTTGQTQHHPHCSLVAETALVCSATPPVLRCLSPSPPTTSPHAEQFLDLSSRLTCSAPGSVEGSPSLMDVLHQTKKPSTRKAYLYKWGKKSIFYYSSFPSCRQPVSLHGSPIFAPSQIFWSFSGVY